MSQDITDLRKSLRERIEALGGIFDVAGKQERVDELNEMSGPGLLE